MENPIKMDDLFVFPYLCWPFTHLSETFPSCLRLSGSFTGSWGFINSSSFTGGPGEERLFLEDALRLTPAKFNSEFTPEK